MLKKISDVRIIELHSDVAENGDLTVMESLVQIPFEIARVFVVRASQGAIRGQHAHKECSQFLTCPVGSVQVVCDDGRDTETFILDQPHVGLLVPPSVWAQQTYLKDVSILTVLCDRPYEAEDYIRNYEDFVTYRRTPGQYR